MSITKRQHYVWRKYLRSWSSNEKINTLLLEKKEAMTIDLMGVAQERYFYKLVELTDKEIELLKSLVKKSHSTLQGLQNDFIFAFTSFTHLNKLYKKNPKPELEEKLREIEINTMEKAHGMMEGFGSKLIACTTAEELKQLLSNLDDKYESIIYLCIQYFRTRKMKNAVLDVFNKDKKMNVENIWNIISFIMATNVAMNISLDPNLRIRFFENSTDKSFITSDQPINNLLANDIDIDGNVKKLEFYYPLNPSSAISVHFEPSQKEPVESILLTESMVEHFNNYQLDNSLKFVFANNIEQIEGMKRT